MPVTHRNAFSFLTGNPAATRVLLARGAASDPIGGGVLPPAGDGQRVIVFTDQTVGRLYADDLVSGLKAANYSVSLITLPDGEQSKSLSTYSAVIEEAISLGVDGRTVIVSLGGGVVCNVAGFVAATLYRGLELVHVPTTLMAQCDAAISHKQAVNSRNGKNLVGSYYAPRRVVVDVEVLLTLTQRQLKDGMAEVLKHALVQDKDLLDQLLDYDGPLRDLDFLEAVIECTVGLKCDVMERDPREVREGMVLQYGHTVGHAVEFRSGYTLTHGESVAIGMMIAAHVAGQLGLTPPHTLRTTQQLLEHYGLPTQIPGHLQPAAILASTRHDKKRSGATNYMALSGPVGELAQVDGQWAIAVEDAVILSAIQACTARSHATQPSLPQQAATANRVLH